jgi:sigma-E factor negative regulatory protein RseC
MATEEGVVFKMGASGAGTAWVKTTRSSACESCSSRDTCHGEGGGKEMEMEVEAINTADARVGDRIVLNIRTASLLKATFLLYVFPILAMIAGAVLGQAVAVMRDADPSGLSALFGFLFFGWRSSSFASPAGTSPKMPAINRKLSRSGDTNLRRLTRWCCR